MRRPGDRAAIASALALLLWLGVPGCSNPFLPSQPEPPSSGEDDVSVPVDFSTPELVLSTMAAAVSVRDRGNGVSAYLAALADSATQGVGAHFDFDPDVVAERQGRGYSPPPGGWTVDEHEKAFYKYLPTLNTGDFELTWTDTLTDEAPDADHQALNRRYALVATAPDLSTTEFVSRGWARIEMQQIPGTAGTPARWVVTRWSDHVLDAQTGPDPSDPGLRCFSRLRIDSFNGLH